ncbi:hypothetical protein [uncultured Vibrio sp.]|uniref:PKD domain-containing protein n=1 Tax=uncultured Vibrio sp. TaxID=114054 RepID=UPI0025E1944E|nr:hypothetical protein [uncultured Vibrio sp.]
MMPMPKILLHLMLPLCLALLSGCDSDDAFTDTEKWTKPTVDAGSDQLHTLPQTSIKLNGSAKSYPKNIYSIKETKWTQKSGPQQLAILNDTREEATLMNPTTAGTYVFELYAKDSGGRSNTDQVKIVLQAASVMSMARKTTGYSDDFQAAWGSVSENYSSYSEIEQQWEEMYQPYLVAAENSETDEEWQQLVQTMLEEVGDERLVVSDLGQLQTAMSAYSSTSSHESSEAMTWHNNNGIGSITFNDLSSITIEQLTRELEGALKGLEEVDELWLEFSHPATVNEQVGLQLMAGFTGQATQLYLNDLETQWLLLSPNVHLTQTIVKVTQDYDNAAITTLTDYLINQEQGLQTFTFQSTFVVLEFPLAK